ncbi:MAG: hypothetical protein R3199_08225 [Gemmatimonadota bacterium]|nr:hypothetical protein [Gemmatimonadota bacterium]
MSEGPASLPWIQLALADQESISLRSQVNVAARRVDVLVGGGLRAAVQPEEKRDEIAFHAALRFDEDASEEQRRALLERLADGHGIDYAIVNRDWLAARRRLPFGAVGTAEELVERFQQFLNDALGRLEEADEEDLL